MAEPTLIPRPFYVYVLFDWRGWPFYVGKGRGNRYRHHRKPSQLKADTPKNHAIRETLRVLGEIPSIVVAADLTEVEAYQIEISMIASIGRAPNGPLVNATDGGHGLCGLNEASLLRARAKISAYHRGRTLSPEHKAKISAAHLAIRDQTSARFSGKIFTVEHRAKIGARRKGKQHTDEAKEKMRLAALGRVYSLETRQKMSATRRGKKRGPEALARMSEAQRQRHALRIQMHGPSVVCPRCGVREKIRGGYCRPCHAAYRREYRRRRAIIVRKAVAPPDRAQLLVQIELPLPPGQSLGLPRRGSPSGSPSRRRARRLSPPELPL
jgi:hypothetical protein